MIRLLGVAGGAAVAFVAFLGGHTLAGSNDHAADATQRSAVPAGSPPAVVASAGRAVALPVVSVRQLPALAAARQRRGAKSTPVQQTAVTQRPVAPVIRQTLTPTTPASKTPQKTKTPSGGSGGYFDDSG